MKFFITLSVLFALVCATNARAEGEGKAIAKGGALIGSCLVGMTIVGVAAEGAMAAASRRIQPRNYELLEAGVSVAGCGAVAAATSYGMDYYESQSAPSQQELDEQASD